MAINPLIALQGQVPDVGRTFSNALLNVGRIEDIRRARAEAPIRERLLEAQTATTEAAVPTGQQLFNKADVNRITSLAQGARAIIPDLQSGNIERVRATLQARGAALDTANIDRSDTDEALSLIDTNPDELLRISQEAVKLGTQLSPGKRGVQFGAQQTFKDSKDNLFFGTTKRNPTTGQIESALVPVSGGAAQPVGAVQLVSGLGQTAAEKAVTEATTAGEKEKAKLAEQAAARPGIEADIEAKKLKKQLQFKPQIEKSVTLARKLADEQGEVLTDLNRSRAAMPGLTIAVNQLKELATVATSTFGGRVFDAAVKETGFGSTKGATARAKFIAIVNNQVLPLLKPTFGGSFSVQEGESLKATMGDPNSSPEEKIAQLDAFIAQKVRDIEAKEAQVSDQVGAPQFKEGDTATHPHTGEKAIFQNGQWQPAP